MRIEVSKKDLLIALKKIGWLALSAGAKARPILENLLLEAKKDELAITASNLSSVGNCKICCKVIEDGKALINAQKFMALVETFKESININTDEKQIELSENKLKIFLPVAEIAQYPENMLMSFEKTECKAEFVINGEKLKTGLAKIIDFKKWDSVTVLGGINFRTAENILKLCATNDSMLAFFEIEIAQKPCIDFIMPPEFATNLIKSLDGNNVKMSVFERQINIEFKTHNEEKNTSIKTVLKSCLINGQYPLYEQLVPKQQSKFLTIEKEPLENTIKKASILKDKVNANDVKNGKAKQALYYLTLECGLLTKINFLNKMDDFISAEYQGEPLKISVNPDYLLKILKSIDDNKVKFEMETSISPVSVKEDKFTCVLMPMNIRG